MLCCFHVNSEIIMSVKVRISELGLQEIALRKKVRIPTVQPAFHALILLTMSSWWPLAWRGAAGLIPVETLSSDHWGSCENEKYILHFLLKTVQRSVTRTAWERVHKNTCEVPLKVRLFKDTSSKMRHKELLTYCLQQTEPCTVSVRVFSQWRGFILNYETLFWCN